MASLLQKREDSAPYTFFSRPRPVPLKANKYRDEQEPEVQILYGNIMYDRRIIRGNTYAQNILPVVVQPDPVEARKQQEIRRLALARKRAKQFVKSQTPEPVEGRKHIDVQTELYLEELTGRVEEADIFTQTDTFLDRPSTPLFIPSKSGVDVSTQILEGELFDFNIEVKPILEVLIGKTVEQSLMEVMEEEELDNLRVQQRRFEELRFAELVETQRLEEQERRHREEKERRIRQQLEVMKKEKQTIEKIAAHTFAQSYLQDLVPSVFTNLHEHGFFYDPVEQDVEAHFMPFLMDNVIHELNKSLLARAVLDSIIKDTVAKRSVTYMSLDAEVEKRIHAANIQLISSLNETLPTSADEIVNGSEQSKEVGPNPTVTFNEEGLKDTGKVEEIY